MNNKPMLAAALSAFQAELVVVGKEKNNPFFKSKYADLASIMLAAQPVLTKHGLSIVQLLDNIDGHPALKTILLHESGESLEATLPLILAKNDPQGVGSAVTYMRRYGYAAALQIVIDEDDDGNRASRPVERPKSRPVEVPAHPVVELASDIQKKAIMHNLEKKDVSPDQMGLYLKKHYNVDAPLTKQAAAKVMDAMITESEPEPHR